MELNAIKITQPLGEFYLTKIKANDLLHISTSSVLRYDKEGNLKGNQRPLKPERLRLIANFIQSEEMCFPTSIIVAANVNESGLIQDEDIRWTIKPVENDIYKITIPNNQTISSLIIDGQHRLNAFDYAPDEYKNIELVCSVFFDLPSPYQAYLFATINGNQKRVDRSLSIELFGYSVENEPRDTWSPEKLAVYLTRKLNFKKDSPLYQRIKLAPLYSEIKDKVDKTKWLLSTASMVEGILTLISANPQLDRDLLAMKKNSFLSDKTRKCLQKQNDKTVLRKQYIDCNDDVIYFILESFFKPVKTILWDNASSQSVIVKTIGISVLFDLLKEILKRDNSTRAFEEYILKIKDVNYSDDYFQLSGKGKTRLRRILKYKLGFTTKDNLEEADLLYFTESLKENDLNILYNYVKMMNDLSISRAERIKAINDLLHNNENRPLILEKILEIIREEQPFLSPHSSDYGEGNLIVNTDGSVSKNNILFNLPD